jgi:hypothetical protein
MVDPGELSEPIKKFFPAGFVREPSALITHEVTDRLSLHLIQGREFRLEMQTGVGKGELQVKGPCGWRPSGSAASTA